MSWEESMFALFDDLEQQAEGLKLAERDVEVAEMTLAEYSRVTLAARLHASLDRHLQVRLVGGHQVAGRLARVGEDWLMLVDQGAEWVVRHAGIAWIAGLSPRADSQETWSVVDGLSLRVLLRRLSVDGSSCLVHFVDDRQLQGRVGRVGRDFVELNIGEGPGRSLQVVPLAAVTALQGQV